MQGDYVSSVARFDARRMTWCEAPRLSTPRRYFCACACRAAQRAGGDQFEELKWQIPRHHRTGTGSWSRPPDITSFESLEVLIETIFILQWDKPKILRVFVFREFLVLNVWTSSSGGRPPLPAMVNTMESPEESFERLRQALNVLKEQHYDPWNWHEYLGEDPLDILEEDEEEEDAEMMALKPKARKNIDRLKSHLITVVQELNRAGHAADLAYYYMSIHPELMKDCVVIMGSAGDIDEDLLLESGDGSPEKEMTHSTASPFVFLPWPLMFGIDPKGQLPLHR
eukprot:s65_g32.t1